MRRTLSFVLAGSLTAGAAVAPVFARVPQAAPSRAASASSADRAAPERTDTADAADAASPAASRFARIDEVVEEAIKEGKLPGAVVLVGQREKVLYRRAYGQRALQPQREAMTVDTIFDAASLTKVVATTTSVMILVQEGRIRLSDRVAAYVPGFERYGKADITIRHLLNHMSGLRPDVDWSYDWHGYDKAIALAVEEVPVAKPNERFIYSDINFVLLGHIVNKVSGQTLPEFARTRIFQPLGMRDTMFLPPASLRPRIAPTERCTPYGYPCDGPGAEMLRGIVHDPTARRMGGYAGHAGLFTTANDLAIFCRMLLGLRAPGGAGAKPGDAAARVLAPLTIAKMITPAMPPGERNVRGLGWDIDSSFSSNRGELLPIGSFGHTGFTGTSIWVDPLTGVYVIFMSNRVHPDGKGDVTPLRARVATIAAAAITDVPPLTALRPMTGADFGASGETPAPAARQPVLTGIDVLRAEGFERLKGRQIGLVTNHTGRARDGQTTIDLLFGAKAQNVSLVALFSPEHGIRGILDDKVASSKDDKTGLPIHSLYGETQRPTDAMLKGVDTLVIDLQDIGARFYTYMGTMLNVMEEAAKRNIEVVVLDRPNPINGWSIEGPTLDLEYVGRGLTGAFPMPTRPGMTLGELARLFNGEKKIGAKLTVIEMKHWTRDAWFDETALPWVNPSPNMRNMLQATLYPGIGAIEASNISVGRGTVTPFEQVGAPWVDGTKLAETLNARKLPGVRFYPVTFTPTASKYANEECQGVFMIVTDRAALRPVRVGMEVASALAKAHPSDYKLNPGDRLFGSREAVTRILAGDDPAAIAASWSGDEAKWRLLRTKYLIYR